MYNATRFSFLSTRFRCLLTLLVGYPLAELPYLKIPLHTVIKLTLVDGQVGVEYHRLPVDCVDTFR